MDRRYPQESIMNLQKTLAQPDNEFESLWAMLQSECEEADVEIVDSDAVRAYLRIHPDMMAGTGRLCSATRREFGVETPLTLKVYIDPEIDDRHLDIGIRLVGYAPDLVKQLANRLDTVVAPFDEELCEATGYVMLMPRFVANR
jgi:hypothetical protein